MADTQRLPPGLHDPGRNIRADVSQRTPALSHATALADRYDDIRTATQTRRMDYASGRMALPPGRKTRKRKRRKNRR
jgi:hypothetical protein